MPPPEALRGGPGQRGHVDQHVGLEVGVGVGQRVGEHQPPLGVGVEHLDGAAAVLRDHVSRPVGRPAGQVLGGRDQAGDPRPDTQLAQRRHDRDHGATRRHVGLHRHHRLARLEREPAGVERDALADQHDVRRTPSRPRRAVVGDLDQPRWPRRPGTDGEQAAEAFGAQRLLVPDLHVEAGPAAELGGLAGQPGRVLLVRRACSPGRGPGVRRAPSRRGRQRPAQRRRGPRRCRSTWRSRGRSRASDASEKRYVASSSPSTWARRASCVEPGASVGGDPRALGGRGGRSPPRPGAAASGLPSPSPTSRTRSTGQSRRPTGHVDRPRPPCRRRLAAPRAGPGRARAGRASAAAVGSGDRSAVDQAHADRHDVGVAVGEPGAGELDLGQTLGQGHRPSSHDDGPGRQRGC